MSSDRRRRPRIVLWITGAALLITLAALIAVPLLIRDRRQPPPEGKAARADAAVARQLAAATPPDAGRTGRSDLKPAPARPRAGTRRLPDHELREVQRRNVALVRSCFERQRLSASQATKVTVWLRIGPGGRVTRAAVDAGGDAELARCLQRIVRSWRFAADLKPQEVVFPLVFGGQG